MIILRLNQIVRIDYTNYCLLTNNYYYYIADPGAVEDLNGLSQSSTSVLITWSFPPCPNGEITGYIVYYRETNATQYSNIDSTDYSRSEIIPVTYYVINNLTPNSRYAIHVRAVSNESIGEADVEINILSTNTIVLSDELFSQLDERSNLGTDYAEIGLLTSDNLGALGIRNIT